MTEAPGDETKLSSTEISESLTGYDEVGITQAFGPLDSLEGNMPARALYFVTLKRQGLNHADAHKAAMSLPAGVLAEKFADEDDDVMPDEPESEVGKDVPPPEVPPRS